MDKTMKECDCGCKGCKSNNMCCEDHKEMIVQIENKFYKLVFHAEIEHPYQLNAMLDKYDVRLLKDKEDL